MSAARRKALAEPEVRARMDERAANFRNASLSPTHWAVKAEQLRDSAEILWREDRAEFLRVMAHPLGPPKSMKWTVVRLLQGLAIECLLKGTIVGRTQAPAKPTHQLVELAAVAGFTVSDAERDLLERFSEEVAWVGRYPAPLRIEDYGQREWDHTEALRDLFLALFERLEEELLPLAQAYDARRARQRNAR